MFQKNTMYKFYYSSFPYRSTIFLCENFVTNLSGEIRVYHRKDCLRNRGYTKSDTAVSFCLASRQRILGADGLKENICSQIIELWKNLRYCEIITRGLVDQERLYTQKIQDLTAKSVRRINEQMNAVRVSSQFEMTAQIIYEKYSIPGEGVVKGSQVLSETRFISLLRGNDQTVVCRCQDYQIQHSVLFNVMLAFCYMRGLLLTRGAKRMVMAVSVKQGSIRSISSHNTLLSSVAKQRGRLQNLQNFRCRNRGKHFSLAGNFMRNREGCRNTPDIIVL